MWEDRKNLSCASLRDISNFSQLKVAGNTRLLLVGQNLIDNSDQTMPDAIKQAVNDDLIGFAQRII